MAYLRPCLVLYTYLLTFVTNLGEKLHLASAMKIIMLYRISEFFSQRIRRERFCFAYGGFVSVTKRIRGQSYTYDFSKFHRKEIIKKCLI